MKFLRVIMSLFLVLFCLSRVDGAQVPRVALKVKQGDTLQQQFPQLEVNSVRETNTSGAKASVQSKTTGTSSAAKPKVAAKRLKSLSTENTSLGVVFKGVTESSITKNTFLCGKKGVGDVPSGGSNFEAEDCNYKMIQDAVGFDMSRGATLQFFNNFTYWLRQKGQREQFLKTNNPDLKGASLERKMAKEGWDFIGAECIIISTNPIVQKVVRPDLKPKGNEVKVVAQLWYNGDDLIQLWSQDVVMVPKGKSFAVALSNAQDNSDVFEKRATSSGAAEQSISEAKRSAKNKAAKKQKKANKQTVAAGPHQSVHSYLGVVTKQMQPANRSSHDYEESVDSPRSIKITILN